MDYIFKVLKEKSGKPWSLYLTKLAFKIEKESKTFPDKQIWQSLSLLVLPYKKILKDVLQAEMKVKRINMF